MTTASFSFKTGDGLHLDHPTGPQVRQALLGLHDDDEQFVILESTDGGFLQAYGSHIDGFDMEYRPTPGDAMLESDDASVPLDVAMRVFEAVLSGASKPLHDVTWHALPFAPQHTSKPAPDLPRRWGSLWFAAAGLGSFYLGKRIDEPFFLNLSILLFAFLFLATVADGFRTGSIPAKGGSITRKENPAAFWMMVALLGLSGSGLLIYLAAGAMVP